MMLSSAILKMLKIYKKKVELNNKAKNKLKNTKKNKNLQSKNE